MKHRMLVIGVGSIGERHVRCMLATGRAEVGICERQDQRRTQIDQRYALAGTYASLDEAMREKWDAAVVATPAPSHISIATKLADAGVNLLIEKPLSTTMDGVAELLEKVESQGLIAAVAYVFRAHPMLKAMRELLLSGRFDKPVQLTAICGQSFPFYRSDYRESYYADRATGGGAIQDALTHMLNVGEWLVGSIDRLVADAAHMVLEGVEVEDTVHVLTRHGNVMGCYSINQHQAPNEMTISVMCEHATLRFELQEKRWRWMDEPDGDWHDEVTDLEARDDWFTAQEEAFLDTLAGKSEPLCTLKEGVQTLKVNIAVLKSADTGSGWVRVE